jgi:hypothetical protein
VGFTYSNTSARANLLLTPLLSSVEAASSAEKSAHPLCSTIYSLHRTPILVFCFEAGNTPVLKVTKDGENTETIRLEWSQDSRAGVNLEAATMSPRMGSLVYFVLLQESENVNLQHRMVCHVSQVLQSSTETIL